jgi:septal ring factor EnvC (AmiA/AmiB activator)
MTLVAVLEERRMDTVPPEVATPVVALATGLITRWITLRNRDRADERQTLLKAFTDSQAALNRLRVHVADLEEHLKDANLMISSLISEAKEAADEREDLRAQLAEHRIRCPGHCTVGEPHE